MPQEGPTMAEMQTFARTLVSFEEEYDLSDLPRFLATGQYSSEYVRILNRLSVRFETSNRSDKEVFKIWIGVLIRHMEVRNGIHRTIANRPSVPAGSTLSALPRDERKLMNEYKAGIIRKIQQTKNPMLHIESLVEKVRDQRDGILYCLFIFMSGDGGEGQYLSRDMQVLAKALVLCFNTSPKRAWVRQIHAREDLQLKWKQLLANYRLSNAAQETGAIPNPNRPVLGPGSALFEKAATLVGRSAYQRLPKQETFDPISRPPIGLTSQSTPAFSAQPNQSDTFGFDAFASGALAAPPAFQAASAAIPPGQVPFSAQPKQSSDLFGFDAFSQSQPSPPSGPAQMEFDAYGNPLPAGFRQADTNPDHQAVVQPRVETRVDQSRKFSRLQREDPVLQKLETVHGIRVIARVGAGGMGEVFLAEQLGMNNRLVCVKRLKTSSLDLDALARFQGEVDAATEASKDVSGIPEQYLFPNIDGNLFSVAEFIEPQKEYAIDTESIMAALTDDPSDEEYMRYNEAYQRFARFMEGGEESETIPERCLHTLLDLVQKTAKERNENEALSIAQHVKRCIGAPSKRERVFPRTVLDALSIKYTNDLEINGNQLFNKFYKALQELHLFGEAVPEGPSQTRYHVRKGGTLPEYLGLAGLHQGPLDGAKLRLLFKVMRDACGEDFPKDELFELYGFYMLAKIRTLMGLDEIGMLHRDLKPDNAMFKKTGASVLFWVTDRMLYEAGTTRGDKKRKKKLKNVAKKGIKLLKKKLKKMKSGKEESLITTIDLGLARRHSEAMQEAFRGVSRSQDRESTSSLRLTMDGDLLGTPHYMAPKTANPPEGQQDDHNADFHALWLTLMEIFQGQKVGVFGHATLSDIIIGITSVSEAADFARAHLGLDPSAVGRVLVPLSAYKDKDNLKKYLERLQTGNCKEGYIEVPLSRIDCEPELSEFLEASHPLLLDMARRCTYLGENPDDFPDVTWAEQEQYLSNWLEAGSFPKWAKAAGGLALTAILGLGGFAIDSHLEQAEIRQEADRLEAEKQQKLKEELKGIESRLKATTDAGVNLRDVQYTSAYFAARLVDIKRLREIKGADLSEERESELKRKEDFYTLMNLKMKYSEAIDEYQNIGKRNQNSPRALRIIDQAEEPLISAVEYYLKRGIFFHSNVSIPETIPDAMISLPTRRNSVRKYTLEQSSNSDIPELLKTFAEFTYRTLDNNEGRHFEFNDFSENRIFKHHEFLIVAFYVSRLNGYLYQKRQTIDEIPSKDREVMMLSLQKCLVYLFDVYKLISNESANVSVENKLELQKRLGACFESIVELNLTFKEPETLLTGK
jgi:serine/threonine protein kinase